MKLFLKKYFLWILVIFSGLIFLRVLILNNTQKANHEIIEAKIGNISEKVSATGKIEPIESVDLSFTQPGKVKNIFVKIGDKVNRRFCINYIGCIRAG